MTASKGPAAFSSCGTSDISSSSGGWPARMDVPPPMDSHDAPTISGVPQRSRARARESGRGGFALLVAQDDGQAALVPEHDDLRLRALGELVGHLDGFPLEELRADTPGHDAHGVRS